MKPLIVVLNSNNPSRIHHLQKLASLRREYRILLVLDEVSDASEQEEFADSVVQVKMGDLDGEMPRLIAHIDQMGVPKAAFTLSEFLVPLQARLVERYKILGPDRKMAEIGRRKDLMREFCRQIGLPTPKSMKVTPSNLDQVRDFRFPVIIKPAAGGGSQLVQRCETFSDLKSLFPRFVEDVTRALKKEAFSKAGLDQFGVPPIVVEELIGGVVDYPTHLPYTVGEISVESVYSQGEVTVLAIHDKPLPNNGPHFEEFLYSTPTRIAPHLIEKAKEYVSRIHRGLGPGAIVLHTEFRTLNDELMIVEFGVRMGGAAIYRSVLLSTGIDMIDVILAIALGRKPQLISKNAIPTQSHNLWAPRTGILKSIEGVQALQKSPCYVEHLLFDEVGKKVYRAPLSTRAQGQVIYQSREGHIKIEDEILSALKHFHFNVEGSEVQT